MFFHFAGLLLQEADPQIPSTFMEFLRLIGSPIFIGFILSLILRQWQWFKDQSSTFKFGFTLGISILLPILSQALVLYMPPAAIAFLEQWWPSLVAGFSVWLSSQVWNEFVNKKVLDKPAEPPAPPQEPPAA